MKPPLRTLLLADTGGVVYVWEDVAPGLAVTSLDERPARKAYKMTHTPTGRRIGVLMTRREARLFAQKIAPLTAWHRRRSIEGFRRDTALQRAVADARREMLP